MRPFYIVKSSGFKNYVQIVLNIGVSLKVGMRVENNLPDPTTTSEKLQALCSAGREALTAAREAHLAEGIWIGSTTDIWIDYINNLSFLSVTAHLIDDKFVLRHRTLAYSPFPGPHHVYDVLEKYESVLRKIGINSFDVVTVVSSCGFTMHSGDLILALYD